jgi:hypothetical protein
VESLRRREKFAVDGRQLGMHDRIVPSRGTRFNLAVPR